VTVPRALLGWGLSWVVAGCGVLEPAVSRQVDGIVTEGRFIDPEAYALYAAAAVREARGEWREALELYQRAESADGRGPELHTRIGAVACKLRRPALADRAFGAAARADAGYGPLWFELARCRQSRGDVAGALSAALEAVRLDPERYEASLLAADLAEQGGDRALAWRLRDGLATHAPSSAAVQASILSAALRDRQPARAARARTALAALDRGRDGRSARAGMDDAVVALERGDLRTAKAIAERVLGADPSNGDALVIALVVADLEQDSARFEALLAESRSVSTPVSAGLSSALGGLLRRRVSPEADRLLPRP
jgi:tetratricopeptide (TPR) repeat protein